MRRNTAGQTWTVIAIKDNAPFAGDKANITAKIRKDGGARVATTDVNPEESEDGQYDFDITASENNAYKLNLYPESSTAGVTVVALPPVIYTESSTDSASAVPAAEGDVPFGLDGPVVSVDLDSEAVTVVVGEKQITRIRRNDAYDGTANAVKAFPVSKNYTGWTGTLTIRHRVTNDNLLSKSVAVSSATSLTISLSSTDTAFALLTSPQDFGPHPFDIEMVSGSSKQSAVNGIAIITRDQTT